MAKVVTDNQYYYAIANAIRVLLNSNNTYTPAQMAPAIIGYIAGGIDLSDVESYFISEVVNAMKYVKELGTTNWVHHIITTDNHFYRNYGHSTAIVKAMQDTGYFSKVINLGDIADNGEQAAISMAAENYSQFNGDLLYCIGNHDALFTDWQTYWFTNLLSDDTDIVVSESDNYNYYWDDTNHHIRYIVYHYGSGGRTYAVARIKDAPVGYSVITLCHYPNEIKSTLLIPVIGKSIDYIGNIAGHMHIDGYSSDYGGMYNQVMLNNDGKINDNENYPKTDGTANSQAITIMSINTSTRNVKFYRIGIPTTLGQNWQYTYVQGGSVESWVSGYYWGTGIVDTNANGYLSTKKYPVYDEQGNVIQYYVYTRTGTLVGIYILGLSESGEWVTNNRISNSLSDVFDKKGGWNSDRFAASVVTYLFSCQVTDLESTDDIVVTTERPNLGRGYSSSLWQTGSYLNSSFNPKSDETSATTYAFDVLPNTTYRFYVDDADYAGTSYVCAFTYKGTPYNSASTSSFSTGRRLGKTSGTWKEITFTTNADEYYCRISIQNITTLTDFATKCKLEVVTA